MKLTWHIVMKDLRRLRWALLLLGAVVGLQYVAWCWLRNATHPSAVEESMMVVLWGLHLLVVWLLVPQFVQADPLMGPAEWRVRPISGARLLAAKLLGIFLMLCVWPSLLTFPWWIEMGFGVGEIGRIMVVNTLGMAVFAGVALLVAVLTENFARFIAWSLVLVVAVGLIALVMAAGMPAGGEGPVNAALLMTRASIAWGVVLVTAVVVVPLQFMGRRPWLARGIAVGAAALAALVVQAWPWTGVQMAARTGMARYALPSVSAKMGQAGLAMPADAARGEATVRVTTEFVVRGLAAGDQVTWNGAEPAWTLGDYRGPERPVDAAPTPWWRAPLAKWVLGDEARAEMTAGTMTWSRRFPAKVAPQLRNGEGLVRAKNLGTLWRGERGPVVPVRVGAGAAHGLRQVHVNAVEETREWTARRVRWTEVEPLYVSAMMLELLNPDGMGRHRWPTAVLMNGAKEFSDYWVQRLPQRNVTTLARGRIPIGVLGVSEVASDFNWRWWRDAQGGAQDVSLEGATLASVLVTEAAPLEVPLAETQFLPEVIVEGSMAETLRRAKAEDRLALVRVARLANSSDERVTPLDRWWSPEERDGLRALLRTRFACGQATEAEAVPLRKSKDDEGAATLVVFNARGEAVDWLRDLGAEELATALKANLEGKTYAASLMEALAAHGGTDRKLRFQLHEALRARGELTGAFNAILWLIENPQNALESGDVPGVGWRLERLVAADGAVMALMRERRERAAETLRRDATDTGAARLLMVTTLALRHDDAIWRELPRLLPHENPLWWEFTALWLTRTVQQKRYREVVEIVDLEKFYAAGPDWVRSQLARRAVALNGRVGVVRDWQRRLVEIGRSAVEALAGAGQSERALRLAHEVRRIDRTVTTREEIRVALVRSGAEELALRWFKETKDGR